MSDSPRDPDPPQFETSRMSFGDHLEELRRRLIYALLGLVAAIVICFAIGDHIIEILVTPYYVVMKDLGHDGRLIQLNPIEGFLEYFKIALKFALVISAPWGLYQIWQFIASGLYPNEQRLVRRFAPASIVLFVTGASFMIGVVLSGLLRFLIQFTMWFPSPSPDNFLYRWLETPQPATTSAPTAQPPPLSVPVLDDDPGSPEDGAVWINRRLRRLTAHYDGQIYYAPLSETGRGQFVQPMFSISEYLGFVLNLALAFGLGFQIPIVVIFVIAVRIVEAQQIAAARKYVILAVAVMAAVLTPTPDVSTMMFLMVPMVVLFEIGLAIGRLIERRSAAQSEEAGRP